MLNEYNVLSSPNPNSFNEPLLLNMTLGLIVLKSNIMITRVMQLYTIRDLNILILLLSQKKRGRCAVWFLFFLLFLLKKTYRFPPTIAHPGMYPFWKKCLHLRSVSQTTSCTKRFEKDQNDPFMARYSRHYALPRLIGSEVQRIGTRGVNTLIRHRMNLCI